MNYLPFAGNWFYGGASATETASFFLSYGLLSSAPTIAVSIGGSMLMYPNTNMLM